MSVSGRPLVSIVTPSCNQGDYLEAAMLSVFNQTYTPIEYIVIDGGSTDGSRETLERHAGRLAYWVSEPDEGQTDAINKGFDRAHGEILAWLNSDDVLLPQAVEQAVEALQQRLDIGMVYGDAVYLDPAGTILGRFPAAQTDYRRLLQGYVHVPQQAAFFRSRIWRMVGPLDPSFYFAMDYDLWVRIAAVAPLLYVRSTWAGFRLHSQAKSLADADRCWPEMLRVHRRLGGGPLSWIHLRYLGRRLLGPAWPLRLRIQGLLGRRQPVV